MKGVNSILFCHNFFTKVLFDFTQKPFTRWETQWNAKKSFSPLFKKKKMSKQYTLQKRMKCKMLDYQMRNGKKCISSLSFIIIVKIRSLLDLFHSFSKNCTSDDHTWSYFSFIIHVVVWSSHSDSSMHVRAKNSTFIFICTC